MKDAIMLIIVQICYFTDRVQRKSKIQTNGSQPEAHVKEELTSSSNVTCNISSNQLEISNIREVVDNGIQKRELVDLEGVVETNLEQSYEKNRIVTKFKDIDMNNEETNIKKQPPEGLYEKRCS